MKKSVLYIYDNQNMSRKARDVVQKHGGSKFYLFASDTLDASSVEKYFKDKAIDYEVLSSASIFHDNAGNLRSEYIKFIGSLGKKAVRKAKNLLAFTKMIDENYSLWWSSLVAEKSTYKTLVFRDLTMLGSLLLTADKYDCSLIIADFNNAAVVKALAATCARKKNQLLALNNSFSLQQAVRGIKRKWFAVLEVLLTAWNYRRQSLDKWGNSEIIGVTYFPYLDKEKLGAGQFKNKYYSELQSALENGQKDRITWIVLPVEMEGNSHPGIRQTAEQLKRNGYKISFQYEYLAPRDWAWISANYLWLWIKSVLFKPQIKSLLADYHGDWDVWPIFEDAWTRSFEGANLLEELTQIYAFRKIFQDQKQLKMVFYIFEQQPWEKALCYFAKKYTGAKLVALQHSIVPYYFLGYFNDRSEIENQDESALPKPDLIACSGEVPAERLRESGWSEETIKVWSTFRHQYLAPALANNYLWKNKRDQIVIATNLSAAESKKLIELINLAGLDRYGFKIIIKCHPALGLSDFMGRAQICFNYTLSDQPLDKLLEESKILIAGGSTAVLEGLAYQCEIITPRLVNALDLGPLSAAGANQVRNVSSSAELSEAIEDIIKINQGQGNENELIENKKAVREYFNYVEKPVEFMADRLNEIGVKN